MIKQCIEEKCSAFCLLNLITPFSTIHTMLFETFAAYEDFCLSCDCVMFFLIVVRQFVTFFFFLFFLIYIYSQLLLVNLCVDVRCCCFFTNRCFCATVCAWTIECFEQLSQYLCFFMHHTFSYFIFCSRLINQQKKDRTISLLFLPVWRLWKSRIYRHMDF
jgi:hypothetical protein